MNQINGVLPDLARMFDTSTVTLKQQAEKIWTEKHRKAFENVNEELRLRCVKAFQTPVRFTLNL